MAPTPSEPTAEPISTALEAQLLPLIHSHLTWLGVSFILDSPPSTRIKVLDYSNPGILSQALTTRATHFTCISPHSSHVAAYAATHPTGVAVQGDLAAETPVDAVTGPEMWSFDLAGMVLGFHLAPDPALVLKRLTERLTAAKGILLVIDYLPHPDAAVVEAGLRNLFTAAGLEDFAFLIPAPRIVAEDGTPRAVFMARGRRAPTAWGKLGRWLGGMQEGVASQSFTPRTVRREGYGGFDLKSYGSGEGGGEREQGQGYGWLDVKNVKVEGKGEAWNPMKP
ncbi:hypothetical protein W97_02714 [Coniosporium apollinis CBS 100218]|uniref:Methyltransferase type 11 domain-containing protein n=1 Tax=Coniosporium apollinis (strain CBS 100218) TaxID=1168221 RepID=R7YP88_CONA1|nr:uncharacterized protein W97_02714 [Coniosporium apollinis CBS 100218]EON63486.1 hypothetical protein W97_02714 [Coniosporium apollinis CBS 100218]